MEDINEKLIMITRPVFQDKQEKVLGTIAEMLSADLVAYNISRDQLDYVTETLGLFCTLMEDEMFDDDHPIQSKLDEIFAKVFTEDEEK